MCGRNQEAELGTDCLIFIKFHDINPTCQGGGRERGEEGAAGMQFFFGILKIDVGGGG